MGGEGGFQPLMALAPLLIAVALSDLRYMRIPNLFSLIALAIFAAMLALGWIVDPVSSLIAAGLVLVAGFFAFVFNMLGGGDVKFLAALMLFVPTSTLVSFGYTFSFAMAVGMLAIVSLRRRAFMAHSDWRGFDAEAGFPMGISIALAGLLHPIVVLSLS